MILIPFQREIKKGEQDIIGVGNGFTLRNVLLLHRLEITSDTKVLVQLLTMREDDITGEVGEEVPLNTVLGGEGGVSLNTLLGREEGVPKITIYSNPKVSSFDMLKQKLLLSEDLADEKDGIIIYPRYYIVLRVITDKDASIFGNFLFNVHEREIGVFR